MPSRRPPTAERTRIGVRRLLREPDFRRLFAVRLTSQCADGVFQASLAGAVLFNPQRATEPADIAAAFAVLLLPYSLLGPFAGVLLDRWSRQRVLFTANAVRALLVVGVGLLIAHGVGDLRFYAAALAVISVNRFFLSALSAALPHVTEPASLISANALSTTMGTVATVTGGSVGVALGAAFGGGDSQYAEVAVAACLGYAASALLARGFGRAQLGPDPDRAGADTVPTSAAHVLAGFVAGARHIAADRRASAVLVAITSYRFLYGLATIATLLLYRNYFLGSGLFPAGLGGLTQAIGVAAAGSVTAAVLTPRAVRRVGKRRWIVGLLLLAAISQLVGGAPYTIPGVLLTALCAGFAGQGIKICVDTTLQETMADSYRGRVFSVYDTAFNVAFVAAAVVAAFVLPISGKSYAALAVVVVGYLLTALGYAAATRRDAGPPPDGS